ncbi:MAG: hypothetical protein Q8M76_02000, partial [Spirochaetaceae bacterium]|nr:hypothetical protein [Spirochaetaceae bacterium]
YRSWIASLAASLTAERAGEPALAARALAASASLTEGRPDIPEIAYRGRLAAAASSVRKNEIAVIALRAGRDAAVVTREYSSRDSAIKKAQELIGGVASTIAERAKAGYLDPYPSEASVLLAAEEKAIADLQALARATLAAFAAEAADIRADASFEASRAAVDAALRGAEILQRTRATALARAAERRQIAEAAIRAASTLLAESRRLLVAADPTKAKPTALRQSLAESKAKLEDAFKKILESSNADFVLSRWEDYRGQYDQLNADLAQAKKDFVVVETFRLLTEGQRYFDQTLYEQAGEVLADAQAIWAEENDEDQPQVKYWLSLVKMASDTTNKREVRPSDALYYDISNYLSEARKQYSRGDTLMKAGRKTEAMQAFEAAKLSIKFITRAFPLNAEAGFLLLQIQKSTDPAAFSIRLPDEIQIARRMLDTNPQEGYSRIADLVRLEPTNATLKNLIIQAEIRVGKRNPPPTAQQIAQDASLISQAAQLLKTGRTADLDRAETLLNQATRLDPNNKNATPLLKDINTIKGKTKGPALGLADQAVLDQATRAYAASQYNQSRDLLNQLLADAAKKTREVLKLDADLRQLGY